MKSTSQFKCQRCGEDRSHYCLGMCNRCYQRHLREKNKDRKIQTQGLYSYKRKKNNYPFASPQLGENYQTDIPELTKSEIKPCYSRAYTFADQESIDKFLKFCKLIFSEYPAEGDIIKGACGIEERALNILEKYGDVNKAMYAVKNPVALMLDPELLNNLSQEDIQKEVNQVWKELVKVKIDNKDEFLEKMKNSVELGITEQELQTLLQLATNMKVKVPKEITNYLTEAENFSKSLRKRLVDKSLLIEELREIVARFEDFRVKTSTMQQLQELLIKVDDWTHRYKKNSHPTVRQLQSMVTEASSLPLTIPELSSVREKYKTVKKWADSVHSLIKSWKCKKDVRTPVSEVQRLISEARSLQFFHHDIQILEESVQKVFEWQERVKMTEEDRYCSEYIVQLLEEGQTLPLEVDSLEGMKNAFHWTARAKKLLDSTKINQKLLAQLANEGKSKNINSPILKEMQNLLNTSKVWREKVKKILSGSESTIEAIQDLLKEGESFRIDEDSYLNQLRIKSSKFFEWKDQCSSIRKTPQDKWTAGQIRSIKKQYNQLSIPSEEFTEIKHQLKSTENWVSTSISFIKKFPRADPNAEEMQVLTKLYDECPSLHKSSQEYEKLEEFVSISNSWKQEAEAVLAEDDLSRTSLLVSKAQDFPVDFGVFEKLSIKAACIEWRLKAIEALRELDVNLLKKLRLEIPSPSIKAIKEYAEIQMCLDKNEAWAAELEKVCEEGDVENLEAIYRSSKEVIVSYEQKVLIKRSLISIYSWKERVREFLVSGGELSEGKALLKEGEYVCFECDEQEQLSALVEKLKILRKKARKLLNHLPCAYIRAPIQPRLYKKRFILEEYHLESTGNTVPDMLSSLESAIETTSPMEPHAFPLYHPTQGLSLIISTPVLFKPLRPVEEKKKRSITYKQINEDVKNIKRPPRRPKNIEISRQSYCICKNEASWNDTIMINCDYCGEWYHPSCISIEPEDIDKIEEFSCFLCYERIGIRYDRIKRQIINYSEFCGLVQECSSKFTCDELREVKKVSDRVEEWKVQAREVVQSGVMLKEIKKIYESDSSLIEEQQYLFDGKIMKCLVEYEGLPVIMEERDDLLNLLRRRDWLREAYQSIYKKNSYRNIKKLIKDRLAFDDEELNEPIVELEKILVVGQDYNQQLQELLKAGPRLSQIKKFFENEEIAQFKLDLFEKTKRKVETFEGLLEEIKVEMQSKEKRKLAALVSKAEKLGIKDRILDEASAACS